MDVVIPLGGPQNNAHNELRYTLRSIEKYMQDLGRVFVVGTLPEWLTNVEHIAVDDFCADPVKNVMQKIRAVCDDARVSADFLLAHDDTFALKDFSGDGFPFYANRKGRGGIGSGINFALHYPLPVNKEMWSKLFPLGVYPAGMSPRDFYCNFYGATATEIKENIIKAADTPEAISAALKGQPFGNVNDRAFGHPEFSTFIRSRFPERSAFECA